MMVNSVGTPQRDIIVTKGADHTFTVTVSNAAGNREDLTGAACYMTIATPTPIAKSVGSGITITDAANGQFQVAIEDTDTAAIAEGSYSYDVWVVLDGKKHNVIPASRCLIRGAVTTTFA